MKYVKKSNLETTIDPEQYKRDLDDDIKQLAFFTQGRVRVGSGVDGERGENLAGEFQIFTSDGSANTEFSVTHTLGSIPIGRIIIYQDIAGHLYQGPTTGTNWTSTAVSFKSDVASVTFAVFLLA